VHVVLRPAGPLRARALAVLAAERRRLRWLDVPGELVLVGGSSVPEALTHADVDLHRASRRTPSPPWWRGCG